MEGEDAVDLDGGLEDVLDGDAAQQAGREVWLERHDHAGSGLERLLVCREQAPGDGDLLHVALAVGIRRERLLCTFRLGVGDVATLEIATVGDVHQIPAFAELPEGHMGRPLFARGVGRHGAELQAVARESHVAFHAGIIERRGVFPPRQHVEVFGVVHRVKPLAVLVAEVFRVAAGENAAGQVPVVELPVDRNLASRGKNAEVQVFCLGRPGTRLQTHGGQDQDAASHGPEQAARGGRGGRHINAPEFGTVKLKRGTGQKVHHDFSLSSLFNCGNPVLHS
ncbi:MAG: hypothetical protein WD060_03915 [Pirellulales bacterium]